MTYLVLSSKLGVCMYWIMCLSNSQKGKWTEYNVNGFYPRSKGEYPYAVPGIYSVKLNACYFRI